MLGLYKVGQRALAHALRHMRGTDLVQEGRHGRRLLHTPQGLHWLWIWPLRGRDCLYWLLRFLFRNESFLFIFSFKESMSKDQIVLCLRKKKTVYYLIAIFSTLCQLRWRHRQCLTLKCV